MSLELHGCHTAPPTLRLSWPAQTWIRASPARQRRCACGSGRKKKGGSGRKVPGQSGGSSGGGSDSNPSHRNMEVIRESREQQLAATDMLAKLLQAAEPAAVAQQYVSSLDEAFFWSANTYLAMAKKEGNEEVVARLEGAIRAAFEAKQATLRPEIQLLNRLLATEGTEQQQQILEDPAAAAATVMNNRYFFGLLDRMMEDVQRQAPNEQRTQLLQRLETIQQAATAAAAGGQAGA